MSLSLGNLDILEHLTHTNNRMHKDKKAYSYAHIHYNSGVWVCVKSDCFLNYDSENINLM